MSRAGCAGQACRASRPQSGPYKNVASDAIGCFAPSAGRGYHTQVMNSIAIKGLEHFSRELADVELQLGRTLGSPVPFIDGLGRFLHGAKGKRLRPALAVLFYKLLGEQGDREELLKLAAVLELIHLATLVHDDVIDGAQTRRNQPALHVHSTNRVAVLEGDFLFVQVFRITDNYPKATRERVIHTVERLLEGELIQESLRAVVPTESQYFEVIEGKTAVLIATACLFGAQWGDPALSLERQQAAYDAGTFIGKAFQLVDDVLDLFGDEQLGKPRFSDLQGGWLTLPLIRLVAQRPEWRERLLKGELDSAQRAQLQQALMDAGVCDEVESLVNGLLSQAGERLSWLPHGELKETLLETIDFVARRRS